MCKDIAKNHRAREPYFTIYPYNTVAPETVYSRLRLFRPFKDLFVVIVNYAGHRISTYLVHFQRQKHSMRCPFISRKVYLQQYHIIPLLILGYSRIFVRPGHTQREPRLSGLHFPIKLSPKEIK